MDTIKAECTALIDSDVTLMPGFVRLVFHDCVGGCNGCITSGQDVIDNAGKFIMYTNIHLYTLICRVTYL